VDGPRCGSAGHQVKRRTVIGQEGAFLHETHNCNVVKTLFAVRDRIEAFSSFLQGWLMSMCCREIPCHSSSFPV
jgi:hypothetical protein